MSLVANTLGVARSTVYARLAGSTKPRGRYTKAEDMQLLVRAGGAEAPQPQRRASRCKGAGAPVASGGGGGHHGSMA